jgi:hypothetical protein
MTLSEIESLAKEYARVREALAERVQDLNDAIAAVKRPLLVPIKRAVALAAGRHEDLRAALLDSPQAFAKPRTQVFHGIKVGFRKGSGGVDWDDDERTADLIKKHFPDQFDVLVKTTRTPIKKALDNLDVSDLKRIGCRVESTGAVVVIKPADSDVDKVVNALLKGATDEAQEEAA